MIEEQNFIETGIFNRMGEVSEETFQVGMSKYNWKKEESSALYNYLYNKGERFDENYSRFDFDYLCLPVKEFESCSEAWKGLMGEYVIDIHHNTDQESFYLLHNSSKFSLLVRPNK